MELPDLDVSPEPIYRMLFASIRSKVLLTALDLRVFDRLSRPKTVADAAGEMGSHPDNTRILLDALASCGLLGKKNGLYRNTPVAQAFLVRETPAYLGAGLIAQAGMYDKMLHDLPGLVKEGPPASSAENRSDSEGKWADMATWMANHERAGVAQQMAGIVSE